MEAPYHVWFSTKGRKLVLEGDIGEDVTSFFRDKAAHIGLRLLEMEVVADHVHLLVLAGGDQTLPSVMHRLKGASARFVFTKYPERKMDLRSNSLWQRGYGWRRLTPSEIPTVKRYIRTQNARPLRHQPS